MAHPPEFGDTDAVIHPTQASIKREGNHPHHLTPQGPSDLLLILDDPEATHLKSPLTPGPIPVDTHPRKEKRQNETTVHAGTEMYDGPFEEDGAEFIGRLLQDTVVNIIKVIRPPGGRAPAFHAINNNAQLGEAEHDFWYRRIGKQDRGQYNRGRRAKH